jgi:hypothetical protein
MDSHQRTRGRQPGFKMPEAHRTKIANSKILNRLISFAEGKEGVEMAPHQVTAALGLIKKVLPDMTRTEVTGEDGGPIKTEETGAAAHKLAAYLDAIASRTTSSPSGE